MLGINFVKIIYSECKVYIDKGSGGKKTLIKGVLYIINYKTAKQAENKGDCLYDLNTRYLNNYKYYGTTSFCRGDVGGKEAPPSEPKALPGPVILGKVLSAVGLIM